MGANRKLLITSIVLSIVCLVLQINLIVNLSNLSQDVKSQRELIGNLDSNVSITRRLILWKDTPNEKVAKDTTVSFDGNTQTVKDSFHKFKL